MNAKVREFEKCQRCGSENSMRVYSVRNFTNAKKQYRRCIKCGKRDVLVFYKK